MSPPDRADAIVVGAGAVGLALGRELARRGLETVILDRGRPGDRATSALGASAGLVNPQAHAGVEPEPVRNLSLLARELYAEWIEGLEEESGLSCEYDTRGGLTVALSDAEELQLDRALDWQRSAGLPFEMLLADEARSREPALGGDVQAAFAFPLDGQVNASRLARALVLAAQMAGADLVSSVPVVAISVESGRVAGVVTARGRVRADVVINASGVLSRALQPLPIEPLRVTFVALDASADPDRPTRPVAAPGVFLVPRRDGTLLVGGASQKAGYDDRPTAGAVASLLARVVRVAPAAAVYPVIEAWVGLFPASSDSVPILGETETPGLFLAAGHGVNSLLLAPATARLVADLITQARPPLSPSPFSPARFDL